LIELATAGTNEERQEAVCQQHASVYEAHRFHYSANVARRQELEAHLLTGEPYAAIAKKMAADPKAIEYYSQIFFDVRDRLEASGWIYPIIRHQRRDEQYWGYSAADAERGYVLRLFAYGGGPHVLDALLESMKFVEKPQHSGDVRQWCDDVFSRLLQTTAAAAAATLDPTDKNKYQLISAALSLANRKTHQSFDVEPTDLDARLAGMLSSLSFLWDQKSEDGLNPRSDVT
jgi:hypothetical protein